MAEYDKPTQRAEALFSAVARTASRVYGDKPLSSKDHAYMLEKMAEGLGEMAVGLRASYTLLKEVKELLQRQKS